MSNNSLTTQPIKQNEILTVFRNIMDEWFKNNKVEFIQPPPARVPPRASEVNLGILTSDMIPSSAAYADIKLGLLLKVSPKVTSGGGNELTLTVGKHRKPSNPTGGKFILYDTMPPYHEDPILPTLDKEPNDIEQGYVTGMNLFHGSYLPFPNLKGDE